MIKDPNFMKKTTQILILIFLFSSMISCEKQDDLEVPENLKINDFVWKGMNLYYLWQPNVINLNDDRFANQEDLNSYLTNFSNPVNLFNNLRIDNSIDRFSVIYSDYSVLEGVLSGTTLNNGADFGLRFKSGSTTDLFGWIRYVLPNSDASNKGLLRGTLFYAVNGTPLTVSNYQSLLSATTYTLNFADYNNGNITPNGNSITLTKAAISENPVYKSAVFNQGTKKIAYLMYNGFFQNYESELNNAFANFKNENATDLILDLRYNSGGSIATATRLASMITGQFSGQLFAKQQWNPKLEAYWLENNPSQNINVFTNTLGNGAAISKLNLSKVYILTSRSTASASELVINGLKPYIEVVQIGDKTTGKNVGSITLYDSPNFGKANANPKHKYAMQPIVLKTINADGFGDYQTGLIADQSFVEDYGNLGEIGNPSEPMLNFTLNFINNGGRIGNQNSLKKFTHFNDSKFLEPLRSEMYVEIK
jgi:hypothetical protein